MKKILKKSSNAEKERPTPQQCLMAASRVIGPVGRFGEDLCALFMGGEVVSTDEDYAHFADVFCHDIKTAVQVKMCNGRHAHRPTVRQVEAQYKEVTTPSFAIDVRRGFYAFVFYDGVHQGGGQTGKSKILSKKLNRPGLRAGVLAAELQYVYMVDVEFMQYLAKSTQFGRLRKKGKQRFWEVRKLRTDPKRKVLYLNRTFLRSFMAKRKELKPWYRFALDKVFGRARWQADESAMTVRFQRPTLNDDLPDVIERTIPVRIIGSRGTVRLLKQRIMKRKQVNMSLN